MPKVLSFISPSAMDERSTEFIVINDRNILDEIQKFNPKRLQLQKATVAIMVCGNQAKEKKTGLGFWVLDGAAASQNILIAANALGPFRRETYARFCEGVAGDPPMLLDSVILLFGF